MPGHCTSRHPLTTAELQPNAHAPCFEMFCCHVYKFSFSTAAAGPEEMA